MNTILTLYKFFFKLGLTCFGGGYGMMSMLLDEGGRELGLTAEEFADMTALDLICSGPIAINGATYVGYLKGGTLGAIAATLGVLTPTILLCILVMHFLEKFSGSKIIKGLFRGIKPACTGLMIYTGITLFTNIFFGAETLSEMQFTGFTPDLILSLVLCMGSLLAVLKFKVDPVIVTLIGAVAGFVFLR